MGTLAQTVIGIGGKQIIDFGYFYRESTGDFGYSRDTATSLAVQNTGRLVVVGETTLNGYDHDFAVIRLIFRRRPCPRTFLSAAWRSATSTRTAGSIWPAQAQSA